MLVRVATYNVHGLRAGVEAAAEALGEPPGILFVQECGPKRVLRRLAAALGMEFVSSHRWFSRVKNAVLFGPDWRLVKVEVVDLERRTRTQPRGYVAATLQAPASRLIAISAHLGLSPRERRAHARELTDAVLGLDDPVVLGADLNEGSEGDAARWISQRLYDAFTARPEGDGATFPAAAPTARIDYVFAGEGLRIRRCFVPGEEAVRRGSDHRPVVAELELEASR
jgi:endonuclease/exonuclease/phosphatase family metal-dependent hydrolase